MTALRVLMLVEDSPAVVAAAAAMGIAGHAPRAVAPPPSFAATPLTLPQLPPQVHIDAAFAPVPVGSDSAGQALAAASLPFAVASAPPAGAVGPDAYVVRAVIDAADLDAVTQATLNANGEPTIFADPPIGLSQAPTCGNSPPVGNTLDVQRLLQRGRLRRLGMEGEGTAIAIVDTGINLNHLRARGLVPRLDYHASWTPQVAVPPGAAPVDHGTMCAYDALISAPNATLLDHAVLRSTRQGGSVMDGVLSDAVQSYGVLLRLMLLADEQRFFHSLVVSNSWGMFHPTWDFPPGHPGRYFDNPQHPFNRIVGNLARAGADILFAAGNCGPTCPDGRCQPIPPNPQDRRISGANSHPAVLSVAGVDTRRQLVGYSSHGPGALAHQKPDVAAYTHFLGSEAFGAGRPDSGTSTACPVLAGVVAALRSRYPFVRTDPKRTPGAVQDYIRKTAVQPAGAPGWNPQTGHGIVDCATFDNAGSVF